MGNKVNRQSRPPAVLRASFPPPHYKPIWRPVTERCPKIHKIVESGNVNKVKSFIEKGGDINKTDVNGLTALHCAVLNNEEEMVEMLLAAGSQLQCCRLYFSPIHFAVQTGNLNIVRMLINHGDSVNCSDLVGNTPLSLSIEFNHADITRLLIYKKAYITSKYLFLSVENGSLEISKLLILNRPSIIFNLSLARYRFTHKSIPCLKLLAFVGIKFNVEEFVTCNRPLKFSEMVLGEQILLPPPHYDRHKDIQSFSEFIEWLKNKTNKPLSLQNLCLLAFYSFCGDRSVENVLSHFHGLPKLITSYLLLETF
ncbi:uncharacterized protein B4U80_11844 [Leptotrombidium deliense]|uniref:Alpha-latrotoxin n=1 Tax=Leptotrombidium deliense TaxID=299467 RepID=A0A443S1S4_9ACAR|nr:uncharacterized protein B4U80_11844 [Leptotrombidium deliense]